MSICSFDFFLRAAPAASVSGRSSPKSTELPDGSDGAANIRLAASGGGAAAHDFFAAAGSMRKAEAMSRAQAAVAKERILGRVSEWAGGALSSDLSR